MFHLPEVKQLAGGILYTCTRKLEDSHISSLHAERRGTRIWEISSLGTQKASGGAVREAGTGSNSRILDLGSCRTLCSDGQCTCTALKNVIIEELHEKNNELQTPKLCSLTSHLSLFLSFSFSASLPLFQFEGGDSGYS